MFNVVKSLHQCLTNPALGSFLSSVILKLLLDFITLRTVCFWSLIWLLHIHTHKHTNSWEIQLTKVVILTSWVGYFIFIPSFYLMSCPPMNPCYWFPFFFPWRIYIWPCTCFSSSWMKSFFQTESFISSHCMVETILDGHMCTCIGLLFMSFMYGFTFSLQNWAIIWYDIVLGSTTGPKDRECLNSCSWKEKIP